MPNLNEKILDGIYSRAYSDDKAATLDQQRDFCNFT